MPLFDVHGYYGSEPLFGGLDSQDSVRSMMERFGMDALALISLKARNSDFLAGNATLREIVDPELGIFGYVTVNPAYPDESIQELRVYLAKHAFIGSVMFPHRGTPVLLSDTREIINAARRYTKPVLIYVQDRDGVRALREIATEFDQTKFIVLNMAGHDWRAAVLAARAHSNIFLDISGTLDSDKIAHTATIVSTRKLLFGSGVPSADPNLYQDMIDDASTISPLDRRRIAYQNALTLFNIEADLE